MAVAYESVSTAGWEGNASSEPLVITKPSGVAVGDLLIAKLTAITKDTASTGFNTLSGWTLLLDGEIDNGSTQSCRMQVYYRVATSADVSASDYTWVSGANNKWTFGSIFRVSGYGSITGAINGQTGGTETYSNTVTPPVADCLLLFLVSAADNAGSGSVASYAIATDNPSWTERYDTYGDSDPFFGVGNGDGVSAAATATRTAVTATGNSSCTITGFGAESVCAIIVIGPPVNVTVSPAVVTATANVQAPAVTGGASVTPAVITASASVQDPTVTTPANKWNNTDKSSAPSWVNPDKS